VLLVLVLQLKASYSRFNFSKMDKPPEDSEERVRRWMLMSNVLSLF